MQNKCKSKRGRQLCNSMAELYLEISKAESSLQQSPSRAIIHLEIVKVCLRSVTETVFLSVMLPVLH
jgi:hypothetical protein